MGDRTPVRSAQAPAKHCLILDARSEHCLILDDPAQPGRPVRSLRGPRRPLSARRSPSLAIAPLQSGTVTKIFGDKKAPPKRGWCGAGLIIL